MRFAVIRMTTKYPRVSFVPRTFQPLHVFSIRAFILGRPSSPTKELSLANLLGEDQPMIDWVARTMIVAPVSGGRFC